MQQAAMPKPTPPLRWAGSKRKLLNALAAAVPPSFSTYIEPFVGSACLFFHLRPKRAILADINPDLIAFYRAARTHPHKLFRSAVNCCPTEAGYYAARSRYKGERDPLRRASLFLFLNRFCFNGLFRTNLKGEFNVPFGTRTGAIPSLKTFQVAANLLKRANLLRSDFEPVLHYAQKGDFVYLDPPYVYRSRKDRGEYGPGSFSLNDVSRLCNAVENLDRRSVRFLLSYLDCEEIRPIRRQFNCRTVPVARTVAGLAEARQIVHELLISNF